MTSEEISRQLKGIATADDFVNSSQELTEAWSADEVGVECIEPILRFMEEHPHLDYGVPGPLVHFIETFCSVYQNEYEKKLIESVTRRPTMMLVWMLNRVLNVTEEPPKRQALLRVMRSAVKNPHADQVTLEQIRVFLE